MWTDLKKTKCWISFFLKVEKKSTAQHHLSKLKIYTHKTTYIQKPQSHEIL